MDIYWILIGQFQQFDFGVAPGLHELSLSSEHVSKVSKSKLRRLRSQRVKKNMWMACCDQSNRSVTEHVSLNEDSCRTGLGGPCPEELENKVVVSSVVDAVGVGTMLARCPSS